MPGNIRIPPCQSPSSVRVVRAFRTLPGTVKAASVWTSTPLILQGTPFLSRSQIPGPRRCICWSFFLENCTSVSGRLHQTGRKKIKLMERNSKPQGSDAFPGRVGETKPGIWPGAAGERKRREKVGGLVAVMLGAALVVASLGKGRCSFSCSCCLVVTLVLQHSLVPYPPLQHPVPNITSWSLLQLKSGPFLLLPVASAPAQVAE